MYVLGEDMIKNCRLEFDVKKMNEKCVYLHLM